MAALNTTAAHLSLRCQLNDFDENNVSICPTAKMATPRTCINDDAEARGYQLNANLNLSTKWQVAWHVLMRRFVRAIHADSFLMEVRKTITGILRILRTEGLVALFQYVAQKLDRREFEVLGGYSGLPSIAVPVNSLLVASETTRVTPDGNVVFCSLRCESDRRPARSVLALLVGNRLSFAAQQTVERLQAQRGVSLRIVLVCDPISDSWKEFAMKHSLALKSMSQTRRVLRSTTADFVLYIRVGAIPVDRNMLSDMTRLVRTNRVIEAVSVRQIPPWDADQSCCFLNWNRHRIRRKSGILSVTGDGKDDWPLEEGCVCFGTDAAKRVAGKLSKPLVLAADLTTSGLKLHYLDTTGVVYGFEWSPIGYLRNGLVNWGRQIETTDYQYPAGMLGIESLSSLFSTCREMYDRLNSFVDAITELEIDNQSNTWRLGKVCLGVAGIRAERSHCQELETFFRQFGGITSGHPPANSGVPAHIVSRWSQDVNVLRRWSRAVGGIISRDDLVGILFKMLSFEIGRVISEYATFDRKHQKDSQKLTKMLESIAN